MIVVDNDDVFWSLLWARKSILIMPRRIVDRRTTNSHVTKAFCFSASGFLSVNHILWRSQSSESSPS
jgi:hypothetical protein